MTEILLVEDDRAVRTGYQKQLEAEGYAVRTAKNGVEAIASFSMQCPDLVLLDIDMPGMNGFKVCQQLREIDCFTPIIFLTAMAADADQQRGLSLGADDYIFKSVSPAILLARIAMILSRRSVLGRVTTHVAEQIVLGQVTINLNVLEVRYGTQVVRLTKNEGAILNALNSERGRLFSREEITEFVHGGPHAIEPSAFRSYIANLRRKLGPAEGMIETIRDCGYRLIK